MKQHIYLTSEIGSSEHKQILASMEMAAGTRTEDFTKKTPQERYDLKVAQANYHNKKHAPHGTKN